MLTLKEIVMMQAISDFFLGLLKRKKVERPVVKEPEYRRVEPIDEKQLSEEIRALDGTGQMVDHLFNRRAKKKFRKGE